MSVTIEQISTLDFSKSAGLLPVIVPSMVQGVPCEW